MFRHPTVDLVLKGTLFRHNRLSFPLHSPETRLLLEAKKKKYEYAFVRPRYSPCQQQIRERVKSMLHQAETLIAKSCYHGDGIRQWATAVEKRYKDFARRMQKYRTKLENKLGYTSSENEVRHGIFLPKCSNVPTIILLQTVLTWIVTLRCLTVTQRSVWRFYVTRRSFFPPKVICNMDGVAVNVIIHRIVN